MKRCVLTHFKVTMSDHQFQLKAILKKKLTTAILSKLFFLFIILGVKRKEDLKSSQNQHEKSFSQMESD